MSHDGNRKKKKKRKEKIRMEKKKDRKEKRKNANRLTDLSMAWLAVRPILKLI